MGKSFKILITIVLLSLSAVFLEGRTESAGITKQEIIDKAWKAMFGERSNTDIRSVYLEGYFHGSTEPSRITIKRPNLLRNETKQGILVFDGHCAAWVKRGPDAHGNPQNPELIQPEYWKHFEVDIAIAFPAFFDYPSEFKGTEKVNGSDAYRLFVNLPLGGNVTYFVDSKTFLVTRRLVDWDGDPKADLWENLIDNYLDYNGIRFPDGYTFQGRNGKEKGFYKNVRFNINPADRLFSIPEDLKK